MPRHGELYESYQAAAEEDLKEAYEATPEMVEFFLARAQVRATLALAEATILSGRIIRGKA